MGIADGGSPKRERILKAALDIAGREGLEALTTRRVACEAEVNLGLLHYYFESKEALVAETLGCFMAELSGGFRATRGEGLEGDPQALLVELLTTAIEEAWRRPGLLFGMMGQIASQVSETAQAGAGSMERLAAAPPPAISSVLSAQSVLVERVGAILRSRLGDDPALIRRRSLQLFTSIFHPLLFTPFPGIVFGVKTMTANGRGAYIAGVVSDALSPPQAG